MPLFFIVATTFRFGSRYRYLISYDGDYYYVESFESLSEHQLEQMAMDKDPRIKPAELPVRM